MKVEIKDRDDVSVVILTGFFTMNIGDNTLKKVITDILNGGSRKILLEFKNVEFINSVGIGELVGSFIAVTNRGAKIKLCGLPEKVLNMLNITRLISIFDIYATEDEAVDSFK